MPVEPSISRDCTFRFEPFQLSEQDGELRKNGTRIKLQEQPFRVLVELVANAGRIVSREDLQQKLWPADTFVDFDMGLNTAIRKLRQALGDDADQPRYIETVAKRGYCFIAPVSNSAPVLQLLTKDSPQPSPSRTWIWIASAVCASAAIAALVLWWAKPLAVPRVEAITQLTDDGEAKSGRMVTDGSRIYFNEGVLGSVKVAQVAVSGGQTATIPTPLDDPEIMGLAPDGSGLLVLAGVGSDHSFPLWSIPLPAGEPHHFLGIEADGADYFPDGRIVFAHGTDVYAAEKDGSNPRKLFAHSGPIYEPHVAPDAKQVTFNLWEGNSCSVVIRRVGDSAVKRIPSACCGQWTPDGKYLVYYNKDGRRRDLWALPAKPGLVQSSQQPIRLTNGPLDYRAAILSRDGKQIFVIGTRWREELVRYDMKSKQFLPFLGGVLAQMPTFSKDGKWVVYVDSQDSTLWRSRIDGTERLQLTSEGVGWGFISPDGKRVAYTTPNDELYMVSMAGGSPLRLARSFVAASWSPDGKLLLVSPKIEETPSVPKEPKHLQILDLQTGNLSDIPTEPGIEIGFWLTQDMLVGVKRDGLMTFEFKTRKWTDLLLGDFQDCAPSVDSKYMYCTTRGSDPKTLRIRLADHKVETITSMKELRRSGDNIDTRVAPDGSPIFSRDIGTQEIYALTVAWP